MSRFIFVFGLAALIPLASPAVAATAKQKMETCKVGADHEKLAGAKRRQFISKCMAPSDRPAKRAKKPQPS